MKIDTLLQELISNAKTVQSLVVGVTQNDAQKKPDVGSWSILEVICHLYDEERDDFRTRLDFILHNPGEQAPQIDPQRWITPCMDRQKDLQSLLQNFLDEREKSIDWLKNLRNPDWEKEYIASWGNLKAGDVLAAWAAHDLLHIRQLVELKHELIKEIAKPYSTQYAGDW